jgi:magnesium transporter
MIHARAQRHGGKVEEVALADLAALHLIRLSESVEDYQEVIAGTLETNATLASNRVNTVARNLAAYAAIFAVVTMISGVYGMNFDNMPELGWRHGYGWALGLMVVSAGGLWVYFKRKGWL